MNPNLKRRVKLCITLSLPSPLSLSKGCLFP